MPEDLLREAQRDAPMERRKFIKLVGGGMILAAGAAGAGLLMGAPIFGIPDSAVAAWRAPEPELELRRFVLSYAILAPNPHNLQPWIADLRNPDEIALRLDPDRLLPATDPFGRQILMGAGAFIELLALAAAERGHRADVILFPEGEPGKNIDGREFARIRLVPQPEIRRDPLFKYVLARRTDRRTFDPERLVSAGDIELLRAAATSLPVRFGFAGSAGGPPSDIARLTEIRKIVREAWRVEVTTEPTMMESMRLLRFGSSEIGKHRDGVTITSPIAVILAKAGLIDVSKFPSPDSRITAGLIADFDAITASTPAYLWIATEGGSRVRQIDAGRAYARVNLAGVAAGLVMQPNEQALQEYAAVADQYQAIHQLLEAPTPRYTVQMLARVGYLPSNVAAASPAPRRGLPALLAGPAVS
jgi:hypothetical protein